MDLKNVEYWTINKKINRNILLIPRKREINKAVSAIGTRIPRVRYLINQYIRRTDTFLNLI